MEHLRSFLGSLQQALDFISSFATYLLGDEPHPGAEEPESGREMKNYRTHHGSEVETAHSGDVSPREHLKVTEGPFTVEINPLSQEIQGTSKTAVTGDQTMESILRSSKFPNRCEGQEESEQKFSVSSASLSDTPGLGSMAPMTGSIQQTRLEEPTMTGRLYQRKSEESSWKGVAQEDVTEEVADAICSQYWKPDALLAEGRELAQMEESGKPGMGQETEQDRSVLAEGTKQGAPSWSAFVGEQKRGPEGADWTREIPQGGLEEMVKIMGNQPLEAEKEQEEAGMGEEEQGEINTAVLDRAEDEGDQVDGLERKTRKSQTWEGEAERITEDQDREVENILWNEGVQEKLLDWAQCRAEKQRGQKDATWAGGAQQDGLEEMARMAKDPQLEVEKEQEEDTKMDGNQQIKTGVTAEPEGDQVKMLEEKEKGDRIWNLEEWIGGTEEGKERKLDEKERGLEGVTWTEKLQCDALNVKIVKTHQLESGEEQGEGIEMATEQQVKRERAPEKEGVQQPLLVKAEMEASQKEMLAGEEKDRDFHWEPKDAVIMTEQKGEAPELEEGGNGQQGDFPEKGKTEENLQQEVEESVKNETQATGEKQEQQTLEEWWASDQEEQPERLADTSGISEEMLEMAEAAEGQSSQLGETTKNLVYTASIDTDLLAGPRAFPDDVTMLDSSVQKERVLLRRKSSIRRAPSLKKSKPSTEAPAQETHIAEDAPSLLEVPRRQNLRFSGFAPMHPNMMAELQMRLQKPK
ncbi:apolipoprotein B receptor [Candoia aspera]|uniref:apolipoprotein B receptor n=1 Tax=Candoia aspera TaxID=51853 RepID=UPI002FD83129